MNKYLSSSLTAALITLILVLVFPATFAAKKINYPVKKEQLSRKAGKDGLTQLSGRGLRTLSKNPYAGAIVIDADTGETFFEDGADVKGYPASMVKMMNLLIILAAVESGEIALEDKVVVSAEAAKIGGSQVYLKEKEVTTVDDLLYALMVQSANDAATALALHYSGCKEAFVDIMNINAAELGMNDTVFHSVHGLPPGKGQLPDVSTPRDMARLSRELLKHPRALHYAATKKRLFRPDAAEPFIMRNHNHLVGSFEGCDGLKTGYFRAAGFSITATAANGNGRAVAVIMNSVNSSVRDTKARELLSGGMMILADRPSSLNMSAQAYTSSVYE